MWKFVKGLAESALGPITEELGKAITDKDKRNELIAKIRMAIIEAGQNELAAKRDIIVAEAQSEHWLTSTWRPIAMLSFVAMLWMIILGIAPDSVMESEMIIEWLMRIIAGGLGGYVVGRSVEKSIKTYKERL